MKMKTNELTGSALNWAVGKADGRRIRQSIGGSLEARGRTESGAELPEECDVWMIWTPSTSWSQGGPLIERQEIALKVNRPCSAGREWEASPSITAKGAGGRWGYGPTPLVAAMRCFIASKLGDEIEIPETLL